MVSLVPEVTEVSVVEGRRCPPPGDREPWVTPPIPSIMSALRQPQQERVPEHPYMLQPDYKEFSRLAREATLVPVVKSVTADLLTPVSAFLAVAEDEPHCFLLESVERGEQIGRYTFLGARPYMRVWARG